MLVGIWVAALQAGPVAGCHRPYKRVRNSHPGCVARRDRITSGSTRRLDGRDARGPWSMARPTAVKPLEPSPPQSMPWCSVSAGVPHTSQHLHGLLDALEAMPGRYEDGGVLAGMLREGMLCGDGDVSGTTAVTRAGFDGLPCVRLTSHRQAAVPIAAL